MITAPPHIPTLAPAPQPSRPAAPLNVDANDPPYQEVYGMLSEAAHLLTRASRELRDARHTESGLALYALVDEIHTHIRRLPGSARHRGYLALVQNPDAL